MNIFIGLSNIASQIQDLQVGFQELGHHTFSVVYNSSSSIVHHQVDVDLSSVKQSFPLFKPRRISTRIKPYWDKFVDWYYYRKAKKRCDVFIFLWNSFRSDHSDIEELHRLGKRIIVIFVGDDIRWFHAMKQEFDSYGFRLIGYDDDYDYGINGLEERLSWLRRGEKFADFIFSRKDQDQLALRPYYKWNMMVDPKKIKEINSQRKTRPIVAHAPSSRNFKGTKFILEAFEKLKKDNVDFEPILIENVPHQEAVSMYSHSDILIDQLLCPGSGKLATEALAAGTIVVSFMGNGLYQNRITAECPIIDVNPDNLFGTLKKLINDYEFRKEHAKKGRPYVEKYLDVRIFCKKVTDLLSGVDMDYDYRPDYFRNNFIPESKESIPVYHKWTEYVNNCDWYKEGVMPGQREGLVF